jgi:hypothetical protein
MQNLAGLLNEVIARTRDRLLALRDSADDAERKKITSSLKL